MKRYLRLHTAQEIWNALAKAFYDGSDEAQIFALNQQAFSTKQVGRPLSTYYGDLVEIFQELDYRDKVVMKDPNDVIAYKKSDAIHRTTLNGEIDHHESSAMIAR
ncbi:hypothetical protein Patl1_35655 [Pistacia atlantica]|nr:hypothetical protein Patl1_35655 [Pistacia atlantica]